jgi:hypothetical protein
MIEKISYWKYVPNGFVHIWEKAGWVAVPALTDTHHGYHATLMTAGPNCQFVDGDPVCPTTS